jgi:uncharacterized RDD family membrane protein YckC
LNAPTVLRRLGGLLYDGLTLVVLWMLASAVFTSIYGVAAQGWPRLALQAISFVTISSYFLWCWTHGGQTLAMKTWRMRVVSLSGQDLSVAQAGLRLVFACFGIGFAGAGLWWALLDREGLFLHDRLAGTRLVMK